MNLDDMFRFLRYITNRLMRRDEIPQTRGMLRGPFEHEAGCCWVARLPGHAGSADTADRPLNSPLALLENGARLDPPHSIHDEIREKGAGRYSHWGGSLYFSTSDNSDPNINGRTYSYEMGETGKPVASAYDPVNFHRPDSSAAAIKRDVEYAVTIAENFIRHFPGGAQFLPGKTVLEIGPGINFGSALVMACYGAKPMVSDRFIAPWFPKYHQRIYQGLLDWLKANRPHLDTAPLDMVIEARGYPPEIIRCHASSLEDLGDIPDGSIDLVYSNAVLEHLYDHQAAFRNLFRISRPSALGCHQVDFRDHRDFSRPLEYLLLAPAEFERLFNEKHGECGHQIRPWEMSALFEAAGFEIIQFVPSSYAEGDYLEKLISRFDGRPGNRYGGVPADQLKVISGFFKLRRADASEAKAEK